MGERRLGEVWRVGEGEKGKGHREGIKMGESVVWGGGNSTSFSIGSQRESILVS